MNREEGRLFATATMTNHRPRSKALATVLSNRDLSELLAAEAGVIARSTAAKAFKRAARNAFLWPEEARSLLEQQRSLTELEGVGPFIAKQIQQWFDNPPTPPPRDALRENFLTLSEARKALAKKPDWQQRYKGDLQMHTDWSDGSGTVQDMADAAIARGYEYIGITDHSKGLKIAGGIDESQLRRQSAEIDAINATFAKQGKNFQVLHSIELNLNPLGEGDMDLDALAQLDLVVGSFHSALRVKGDQTDRYLAALRNPSVHILGHPRGRVFNYRIGLTADWKRVFAEAARLDKAVEVDSYPDRQDLDIELLQLARAEGCKIAIDTDAHHPWQLAFIELGLAAALLAGIEPENIINFMPANDVIEWAKQTRGNRRRQSVKSKASLK